MLDEDEAWNDIFSGNPDGVKRLEQVSGWKYRAYGEVVSVSPVRVDCGIYVEEDVVRSSDARTVGEFVAFTITRLTAMRAR